VRARLDGGDRDVQAPSLVRTHGLPPWRWRTRRDHEASRISQPSIHVPVK
jgi:hypothetical protein